ncbi:MAG: VanZ family protein [Desulfotalea sp.]
MRINNLITKNIWLVSWLTCLLIFSCAALVPTNSPTPGSAWQLDKVVHFVFFAFFTIIPLAFFSRRKWAFFCTSIIPIFGFTLEYMQKNISGREFSPEDMIANNVGITFGIACGIVLRIRRRLDRQKGTQS